MNKMKKTLPVMLAVVCALVSISLTTAFAADDLSTNIVLIIKETENTSSPEPDTTQAYQDTQAVKTTAEDTKPITNSLDEEKDFSGITSFIQTSNTIGVYIIILVAVMCLMLVVIRMNKPKDKKK